MKEVETAIDETPGIESWHHLHVWAVSTTENAATLHIVLKDLEELETVTHALKHALRERVSTTAPSNVNGQDIPAEKKDAADVTEKITNDYQCKMRITGAKRLRKPLETGTYPIKNSRQK